MIELREATRRYGEVVALDDVTISIDRGASVALMGPNGAGKSTLLRVAAGLARLTEGSITVNGTSAADARHVGVGLLAHESYLYGGLTPRENLSLVARLYEVDPATIEPVLDEVGMSWAADTPVDGFSRGMEQRIALARVLLTRPSILLLDEPFAGLDAAAAEFLTTALRRLRDEAVTLVLVTHDPRRAAEVAERAIVLARGRVHRDEPVGDPGSFPDRYLAWIGT